MLNTEAGLLLSQKLLRCTGGAIAYPPNLIQMRKTNVMGTPAYFEKYENLAFTKDDDGVLVLRFHTNGGPIVFTGQTHADFPAALEEIALDRDNKALVITGTGDSFIDRIDGPGLGEIFKPKAWEKTRTEGAKVLQRLLELPDARGRRRQRARDRPLWIPSALRHQPAPPDHPGRPIRDGARRADCSRSGLPERGTTGATSPDELRSRISWGSRASPATAASPARRFGPLVPRLGSPRR